MQTDLVAFIFLFGITTSVSGSNAKNILEGDSETKDWHALMNLCL